MASKKAIADLGDEEFDGDCPRCGGGNSHMENIEPGWFQCILCHAIFDEDGILESSEDED